MIKEFKKFILRGNLVDLAIGFTVGTGFSTVAKSLVDDIIMPPIGMVMGGTDFSDKYILLKSPTPNVTYDTLEAASQAGAVTLNYGRFINNILALLFVALAMFVIVKAYNRLENQLKEITENPKNTPKDQKPENKKCPFCYSTIPYPATRCPNCTSKLSSK